MNTTSWPTKQINPGVREHPKVTQKIGKNRNSRCSSCNLYGQPIDSVRWDQRYEISQFKYDPDFVQQGLEPSPLMMPVREGHVYSFGK